MLLVKLPGPVPFVVLLLLVLGFAEVLQQTPRAVTVPPPSAVTFPPLSAMMDVTPVTTVVETVGRETDADVVNVRSMPYAVPALLVA